MKTLWRLALAADIVALGTIMLGSWTRIHGAGLTCPDWPLCHGRLVPSMADGTIWEWTHRLLAFCVTPLVLLLVPVAWRRRCESPFVLPTTAAIVLLFAVQVVLGAATVRLDNTPISVVLHWGTAMAFVAALTAMTVFGAAAPGAEHAHDEAPASANQATATSLAATALVAFATMCIGAYVSSSGAGLACLSIPECAGNVVVHTQGQEVQMLHRLFAAATLLCTAASMALAWARPASARVRAATSLGAAFVCAQIVLGLLNVALRLPTDLREAHAINAAFVFLAFVVATLLSLLDGQGRVAASLARAKSES